MPLRKKIMCIVGTRPEAIKMAPVIQALLQQPWVQLRVVVTAQHRHMLDQVFSLFGLKADVDLDLMRDNQTLADISAATLSGIDRALANENPNAVIAQGDTTTVLATAMAAFYRNIPFCHVEAGLRTYDLQQPFPEEFNRQVASRLARLHFAPTSGARENLIREGTPSSAIVLTGNTVIDALLWMVERKPELPVEVRPASRVILATVHRRESFGDGLNAICRAIRTIVDTNSDVDVILPVHPNPNVRSVVMSHLVSHNQIKLVEPLAYGGFVAALQRATIVLTDSGGVQEEAPALGKPVLVMRTTTERPEAVQAGVARLVGVDEEVIRSQVQQLLDDPSYYSSMAKGASPYGDGNAASRIVVALKSLLSGE